MLLAICGVCVVSAVLPTAKAFDPSQRAWVTIQIPTFAENNILIQLTAVTPGNNLNQNMSINEPSSVDPSVNIGVSMGVSVTVSRAVIQAEYSSDTNTTTFTYVLSPYQYTLQKVGNFPDDKWNITISFSTSFNAPFDPRFKYCLTPSPNYYGNYTIVSSGDGNYAVNLVILHPSDFAGFVNNTFLVPMILLAIPWAVCVFIILACTAVRAFRKTIEKFYSSFVTICSAVIVFIPVFQFSTLDLKTPLQFTWFDEGFLLLLLLYIGLLAFTFIAKFGLQTRE
ncbi:MAG: hypothetical protein ABSB71_12965 [Candidatus Bathyarchaeia archaeon]